MHYVCALCCLFPEGHMDCANTTEGGQLSSFVISRKHLLIPVQRTDGVRVSATAATYCSLPVRQLVDSAVGLGSVCETHGSDLYLAFQQP